MSYRSRTHRYDDRDINNHPPTYPRHNSDPRDQQEPPQSPYYQPYPYQTASPYGYTRDFQPWKKKKWLLEADYDALMEKAAKYNAWVEEEKKKKLERDESEKLNQFLKTIRQEVSSQLSASNMGSTNPTQPTKASTLN
jgi:hypothetical protein